MIKPDCWQIGLLVVGLFYWQPGLMEIDALYCDVIVRRWEQFTGQKAKQVKAAEVEASAER